MEAGLEKQLACLATMHSSPPHKKVKALSYALKPSTCTVFSTL